MKNLENMQMPVVDDKSVVKPAEEEETTIGQYKHIFKDGTVDFFKNREELAKAVDAENENSK